MPSDPCHVTSEAMIALQGGGPFEAHDDVDRELLQRRRATTVAVLPTADAMEDPELLVEAAAAWADRVGSPAIDAVIVLERRESTKDAAQRLCDADAVYVVGDSPLHLRSAIKDTPVMDALRQQSTGGLVVAVGASAAALCDPMTDPRGGAFTLGLGLVPGLALVTEAERWTEERLLRTRELAAEMHESCCLAILPSTSALVLDDDGWNRRGDVELIGELPAR